MLASNQRLIDARNEEENIDDIEEDNIEEHFNNESQPMVNIASQYFSYKNDNLRVSNQEEEELRLSYELGLCNNTTTHNKMKSIEEQRECEARKQLRSKIKNKVSTIFILFSVLISSRLMRKGKC